ncbi:MAG: HAD-IC family P-type ATPase [Clostridiales bacterium]|nr:HAD-IC family P-type ATPase [Clostridiales bacterium]
MNKLNKKQQVEEPRIPQPERIATFPDFGLSGDQVRQRIAAGLDNKAVDSPSKTVPQIIAGNILTYFNLIFVVLAISLAAVGSFKNMMFLVAVVVNTLIGIVQELRAKKTLDKLVLMSEPKATVIRDSVVVELLSEETVLDDIAVFGSDNQIYADAILLTGELRVNESLVTGESDEIMKKAGDKLISGSFVVSGEGRARLERVGRNSFVSKMTVEAKKAKKSKQTGMMRDLTRMLQLIGIAIIPVGIMMYTRQTQILGLMPKEGIENTTAALVGMIPEGLYLLVSVALAVSVMRLSKKHTLVRDLKCIETLARADVFCVDKTGTITENHMDVTAIVNIGPNDMDAAAVERLLTDFAGDMPGINATMQAIKKCFNSASYRRAVKIKEFSSADKYSAVSFGPGENYALGAPEFILRGNFPEYQETINTYAETGSRVLLLAGCGPVGEANTLDDIKPIALIVLENPVKPTARATFEFFREQGVAIKVISGDNPLTVAAAAKNAGIEHTDRSIDAPVLDSKEKIAEAAGKYTVFGRVTPEQKRQLILALKKAGHTVAMTGDGVNDVLALKAADCSVAMASGSDVASKVSHLVMLNSDFDSMPAVVAEGRRVINNIERTASLFLVKNIFSFILAIISIFAVFAYPLTPAQLSLASMLTIGIPSFFLSLEPNKSLVRGRFIVNVIYRALPAALTDLFIIIGVVLFKAAFDLQDAQVTTIAAVLITCVGFIMVWKVCKPFNWMRAVMLASLVVLFVGVLAYVPDVFSIVPIDFGSKLVLGVFVLLIPSVMWLFSAGIEKIAEGFHFIVRIAKLLKEDKKPEAAEA